MRFHNVVFSIAKDLLYAAHVRTWADNRITIMPFPRCWPWRIYTLEVEDPVTGHVLLRARVRRVLFEKIFEVIE